MIFQVLSFMLITCFYGSYFLKQLLLRKKGIVTNRLARGKKSTKTAKIETALLAATYSNGILQYLSVFHSRYIGAFFLPATIRYVGLAICAVGVLFFLFAIIAMRDNWRAGIDKSQVTTIVKSGVYRISRNPAFVGFDLMYIGFMLAMPNIFICTTALITILLIHQQILEEEKYLPQVFGAEYTQYKINTPMYLFF